MLLLNEVKRIESTKADWEPIKAESTGKVCHPVVKRCLELRALEIDVKDWTEEFNQSILDQDMDYINEVLDGHAKDEDNHDIVLGYLAEYWGETSVSDDAQSIIDEWVNFDCNSMVKKTFLEAGVFFTILPLLTKYSQDTYTSRVADWIRIDEVRHVRISRLLMRHLSLKGKKSILSLVEKTIRYVMQSEPEEDINRWVSRSLKTAIEGKCQDFAEDSLRIVAGHFDQHTRSEVSAGYKY